MNQRLLKKIGSIRNSPKIISGILTLIIIGILLFSGPAKAITLGIPKIFDTTPNEDSTVSFLAKIDLHTNDRIPLTNVTVNIKNSNANVIDTCTFYLNGTELSDTNETFVIEKLHSNYNYSASLSGYGYGYGYDSGTYTNINQSFGYGYGYLAGYGYNSFSTAEKSGTSATTAEFIYNVTWTTPSVAADSTYSIQLMAYANDGTNTARYYTVTDSSQITVQNVVVETANTGGGSHTSSYALTNTELSEGYTKPLAKGDKMVFNFGSESHSLTVKNLNSTTATIEIASTPQTVILSVGEEKKIELSGDNYYDLLVKLNSIALNKANITIKTIYEEIIISQQEEESQEKITGEVIQGDGTIPDEKSIIKGNSIIFWIFILIVALILIIIGYKFLKKNKKPKEHKKLKK